METLEIIEHKAFDKEYLCYSFGFMSQTYHGKSIHFASIPDKIIMPLNAVEILTRFEIPSPFMFRLWRNGNEVYTSVHQFTAHDKMIYVPDWMMKHLSLKDGDRVYIRAVTLPIATSVIFAVPKLFLKTHDPKTVIEVKLKDRTLLQVDDSIKFTYARKQYQIYVAKLEPTKVCSIINADINLTLTEMEP